MPFLNLSEKNMKAYRAYIINPIDYKQVQFYPNGLLVIDETGKIQYCGAGKDCPIDKENYELIDYSEHFILPGLIDTHVHLPQYSAIGKGRGELLPWLEDYIFPLEAKFNDDDFAREQSRLFFKDAASYGTTTSAVYCSSHKSATAIAFETAQEQGIRAFIGNSLMDSNVPSDLLNQRNIEDSIELMSKWHDGNSGLLRYILTPRYAGCCTMELMKKCAEISRTENLLIQTHIAENREELQFIKSLYLEYGSYAEIYQQSGLLGENTILAHGIYLDESEVSQIKDSGATIAHCPTSNRFLQSGFMPLRKYLNDEIHISFGSDIAGGYSLSMLNEAREAIETSKTRNIINHPKTEEVLTASEALALATIKGAETLKIDSITGNLIKNKESDFIVLDGGEIVDKAIENEDLLSSIIYKYAEKRVLKTFVRGEEI
jgi:guanine deaminase